MKIYIAAPYTLNPVEWTRAAMQAWHQLRDLGHVPFVPHLAYFLDAMKKRSYHDWLAWDLAWLEVCDGVLRLPGHSPGAAQEVAHARALGIPVYNNYSEIPPA